MNEQNCCRVNKSDVIEETNELYEFNRIFFIYLKTENQVKEHSIIVNQK